MWRGGQCGRKLAIVQQGNGRRRFFSSNTEKQRLFGAIKSTHVAGVGALVLTLATQNLAQELVGGLDIQIQDEVSVGDEVKLGDGTGGIVHGIGWLSSTIRGYDDLIVRIPNSQLLHQRITNISKAQRSQVKQILRFKYANLDKIPSILQDIKQEVKMVCPKLVSEGAIYRAVITSFESDHVQATVNFHFDIPAETEASNRNRQEVLLAIARIMQQHNVEFALPTFHAVDSR